MCVSCTCNSMPLEEALKIAEMCRSDEYPPTNPGVLLRAALTIYKKMGICMDLYSVTDWLKTTVESGCSVCL